MWIPILLAVACDHSLRQSIVDLTSAVRFRLAESPGKATLSRFFETTHPDLVVIGPALAHHSDALRIGRLVRQWAARVPIIVVTAHGSEEFAVESMRTGINDYFRVPLDSAAFRRSVERLMPDAGESAHADVGGATPLIGAGPAAEEVRSLIARIAPTDCNVLITGETGTGKELAAKLLHAQSRRFKQPFVSINCAAIPDTLLESELFGHERGAFTGAAPNIGRLSAANGGTAFFDEVGDMSPASQSKVLRLVEDKEVPRLGSARTVRVDARIVAATNQPLEALVADGRFRGDLYFRLNVARIQLLPLRERKDDIPLLAMHYVGALRKNLHASVAGFSADAMEALTEYDWPGNVRELRNVVERVLMHGRSLVAGVGDLPQEIQKRSAPRSDSSSTERIRLCAALASAGGNKSEAARALRCSRMTLYRRMARCGLRDAASVPSGRRA
jgi:DNA-binding NtrC family response regulator